VPNGCDFGCLAMALPPPTVAAGDDIEEFECNETIDFSTLPMPFIAKKSRKAETDEPEYDPKQIKKPKFPETSVEARRDVIMDALRISTRTTVSYVLFANVCVQFTGYDGKKYESSISWAGLPPAVFDIVFDLLSDCRWCVIQKSATLSLDICHRLFWCACGDDKCFYHRTCIDCKDCHSNQPNQHIGTLLSYGAQACGPHCASDRTLASPDCNGCVVCEPWCLECDSAQPHCACEKCDQCDGVIRKSRSQVKCSACNGCSGCCNCVLCAKCHLQTGEVNVCYACDTCDRCGCQCVTAAAWGVDDDDDDDEASD
jgi:hypothetical protein